MASFQAKIGWKSQTRRENKNYRSVPFPPNGQRKFKKKITKKFEKIKYTIMATFQAKIG